MKGGLAGHVMLATVLGAGCSGVISEPTSTDEPDQPGNVEVPDAPPRGGCRGEECLSVEESPVPTTRFPRLSHQQWESTVQDLFRLDAPPNLAGEFFPDVEFGTFDTNARRLVVTTGLWSDYQRAAERVAEDVTQDPTISAWLPSGLPAAGAGRRDAFLSEFGLRAYRRPLTEAELGRLAALFDMGADLFASLDPFRAGVRLALEAMLQSPHFLYRVEQSADVEDDLIVLDDYEIASRLSYLLWDTMPDDRLFDAAAAASLTDTATLRAEAERMLADHRADAKLERFHEQLLEMDRWTDTDHSVEGWRPELAPMMLEESRLFIKDVLDTGGTLDDLLTSNVAFVNEELATLYGIPGITGTDYQRVTLPDTERAGLFTRLSFLSKYATLTQPDPIHRGVLINNRLLCRNIQAPPSIPDDLMPAGETNRERITSITGPGTCGAACHGGIINPIGFAFEAYDAMGRVRTEDNGHPIDDSATYVLPDGETITFDGAVALSRQLADAEALHRCYTTRLLEFAYGREYEDNDSPLVHRTTRGSRDGELGVRELLVELIASRTFRTRAAQELDDGPTEGM